MLGLSPDQGQADLFKTPAYPAVQSSASALPMSSHHPLDKARRKFRSALWAGGLAEPPH
jgi:hypothetical protein